jgi:hypothetical protein
MNVLTDKEIAELRRIDAEAEPAPWFWADGMLTSRTQHPNDIMGEIGAGGEMVPAARNALPRLLDEVERRRARDARLLELLKRTEWSANTAAETGGNHACPECGGEEARPGASDASWYGHQSDCVLAALILELQLDAPETSEEKAALDKLAKEPEQVLAEAKKRGAP